MDISTNRHARILFLEAIELQDSAYPYHDWNERVASECYAPNATSRILDGEQRIIQLVNNYSRISFNSGRRYFPGSNRKLRRLMTRYAKRTPAVGSDIPAMARRSRKPTTT